MKLIKNMLGGEIRKDSKGNTKEDSLLSFRQAPPKG